VTCPHTYSDGAYVLGALSPAERAEYEAHLPGCRACSAAVARLAPVPGLLGRVDPAALLPPEPGASRLPQLLTAVSRQRRRQARVRRWQLAAAALAAAGFAAAGGVAWSGVATPEPAPVATAPAGTTPGPSAAAVAMTPVDDSAPITAEVAVGPVAGGTEVWMTCWYPAVGYQTPAHTFRLFAVGVDGSSEQLGSWRAAPGDEVTLSGLSRFRDHELARLELRDADGTPLLTHELS
jgi:anti-sigma factor RsiW